MTAAVARPPIFNHLVASRPDPDRTSLPATALSVLLHGVAISAVVLLGARVGDTLEPRVVEKRFFLVTPTIAPPEPSHATGGGGVSGPAGIKAPTLPNPIDIPVVVPPPGGVNSTELQDLFKNPSVTHGGSRAPVAGPGDGPGDGPGGFVAHTKAPALLNRPEVARLMERNYPRILADAGIGGTVTIWLRIDIAGKVLETRVSKASGQESLDQAALRVGKSMQFSPAMNRDVPVQIWVEIPVVFTARE